MDDERSKNDRDEGFPFDNIARWNRVFPEEIPVKKNDKKDIRGIFRDIFKLALIAGLPLSPAMLSTRKEDFSSLEITWCVFMTILKTAMFCFNFMHNHLLWKSPAVRMCVMLHCLTGYAVMVFIILRQRRIVATIKLIRCLSLNFDCDLFGKTSRKFPKLFLFSGFLFLAVFALYMVYYFFVSERGSLNLRLRSSISFPEDSPLFVIYSILILFSAIFSYHMSTIALYVGLFICGNAYLNCARLISFYGEKLKEVVHEKSFSITTAAECLDLFKDIILAIDGMDKSLNACALIIYMAVINSVFNFLSVVMSVEKRQISTPDLALNVFVAISALFMFLYLTICGERLPSEGSRLRKQLIPLSNIVINQTTDSSNMLVFKILSSNIKANKPYVTGYGLFNITKYLIPSFIGVIATYGFILEQIGATKSA